MTVNAEIIAIGDELTSGQRLDTNSQWLSQQLTEIGIGPTFHTTVGDDEATISAAFTTAFQRAQVVLCTGGLGPTADDLTRVALARAAQVSLERDEASLQHIRTLFERRGRNMSASNEMQAYFPAGSRIIPNRHGTAPGIDLTIATAGHTTRVFALPGVPAELKRMWAEYVISELNRSIPIRNVIRHSTLHCFGAGESEIESRLGDLTARGRRPQVGITASQATITLRVVAEGTDEAECQGLIKTTERLIREKLGELVFGTAQQTLQDVVVDQLQRLQASLSVVDLSLAGQVQQELAQADRDHRVVPGGWVAGNRTDLRQLMVEAQHFFQTNLVLGIGQLQGTGDGRFREVVITGFGQELSRQFDCASHPDLLQVRSVKQAINFLRLTLAEKLS